MDRNLFYDHTQKLHEAGYGKEIVEKLISMSSSEIGYRLGGTKQEHEASAYIAKELCEAGLKNVELEEIPVDGFELKGAFVTIDGTPGANGKSIPLRTLTASQIAGFRGTPEGGHTGELVYVGTGTQAEYEAISKDPAHFKDKIVLLDARFDSVWIGWQASEATVYGAKAAIFTYRDGMPGNYLTYAPDMLIGADGENNYEDIPIVYISKQDGDWLKERLAGEPGMAVKVESHVDVTLAEDGGVGYNVTAEIPGKNKKQRILLAAHQDAHLESAADDTGSVATVMTIAKAMAMSGYEPESTIQFLFTSSEEYGKINTVYDWQHGAVCAITGKHQDWTEETAVVLNYEVMPEKGGRTLFRGVPEVMEIVESCAKNMRGENYPDSVDTLELLISIADEWVLCAAGIPCVSVTSMREDYLGRYHTNYDKEDNLDYEGMRQIANASFDLIQAFDQGLIGYSLDRRANDLKGWYRDPSVSSLENEVLVGLSKEAFAAIDLEKDVIENLDGAISAWDEAISDYNERKEAILDHKKANQQLMRYNKAIFNLCVGVSIGQNTIYPYMQTLSDALALKKALKLLEADAPDAAALMEALNQTNLDLFGWMRLTQFIEMFSLTTCRRMFELYREQPGTWASLGKLSPLCDVYAEYVDLRDSEDPDYPQIKEKLEGLYQRQLRELKHRMEIMTKGLHDAAHMLADIK